MQPRRAMAPLHPSDFSIQSLLMELRIRKPIQLRFHHGGALRGLLSGALGVHELPAGMVPVCCEMGHVQFSAGDRYRVGLYLLTTP